MDISRDNYEHYFLDYLEGRLSPNQQEILDKFLKFNPDLAEELAGMGVYHVGAQNVNFPGKDRLKKMIPSHGDPFQPGSFEMFAIAYLEGDLDAQQKSDFHAYLDNHPEKSAELELLLKAHFTPQHIIYPAKSGLKKRNSRKVFLRYFAPVAAAAAVLFAVIINLPDSEEPVEVATADQPEEKTIEIRNDIAEKAPAILQQATSINVIRKKNVPVPVSNYKEPKDENQENQHNQEISGKGKEKSQRIASLKPSDAVLPRVSVRYDEIQFIPVDPPNVNISSISFEELARNQIERLSSALENEDDLILSLASSGLREINKLTGSKAEILASRDEQGDVTGVLFKSRFLQFSAPLSTEE